jgi:hypothetical protein
LNKPSRAIFSVAGAALHRAWPIFAREPAYQLVTAPLSLTDGARLSAPSSPKFPLLHARVSSPSKFPVMGRPPITTPRHKKPHVFACHLEPSRRLQCAMVSHHHCAAALLPPIAALAGMPHQELSDEASCRLPCWPS